MKRRLREDTNKRIGGVAPPPTTTTRWSCALKVLSIILCLVLATSGADASQGQANNVGGGVHGASASTYASTASVKDPAFLAAGPAKSGLRFDGRNDFALVREFKNLPSTRITVCAWIKVQRHKSFSRILSHEWIGWGWNLYTDGAGLVRFGIGQDNKDFAAGRIIFKNKWHFVVGRYDGQFLQAFVDGMPGAKTSLKDAVMDNTGYVSIAGAEYDPFPGELDDIRIYNRSLSNEEIMQAMVMQPKADEEGLVAYWKMDEAGGDVLYDQTSHQNHAELGKGKRRPLWVQSHAPVSIPCVKRGENITLTLDGVSSAGMSAPTKAFVTSLPDESIGTLYQIDGHQTTAITGSPVEIHANQGKLVFSSAPSSSSNDGKEEETETACAIFDYRVHDGEAASSAAGVIAVDVVPTGGSCQAWKKGWVERKSKCWRMRTEMEHVRPHSIPPKVSIVIPLYNQADLLVETVQSVLNQTFEDWEMVIVNDGSTDEGKSLAAAKAIVEKSNMGELEGRGGRKAKRRIKLVEKINGGLADARNAGIQAASGEWIFPLDSDDLIGAEFLERAVELAMSKKKKKKKKEEARDEMEEEEESEEGQECNLVIADLKGFGAWEYAWHVPEYSARDLRYSNMFHCSALFHKSLWQAVPRGYPVETLFGYEDWAFWVFAEERLEGGIKPCYIHEELFFYRIRPNSMHQSLLKNQEYSIASLRMLHPNLFPSELVLSAHDKFLGLNSQVPHFGHHQQQKQKGRVPEKVHTVVKDKSEKFPWSGPIHTMKGLLLEGSNKLEDAREEYLLASYLSSPEDWQPKWRLGLIDQRLGRYEDGNRTLHELILDFDGVGDMYRNLGHLSDQAVHRGPVYLPPPPPAAAPAAHTSSSSSSSSSSSNKDEL